LIQIKYFPGNTLLHRLDFRTKLLLVIFFIFIEVAFLDVRILLIPFLAAVVIYLSARVPFREVRSTWKFLVTIIVFISSINALFTLLGATVREPHIIVQFAFLRLTWEGVFFAVASIMRFLSLAMISFSVIMTTDPALYGPALAKLGIPYKGAYVVDLALRYLPTYVNELETTTNAQMARGYKAKTRGGLFARILNTVPLLLPVTINATLSIHDVADAMELRAFGSTKKRTWYRTVHLSRLDYAAIALVLMLIVLAIYLRTQFTTYWIPV